MASHQPEEPAVVRSISSPWWMSWNHAGEGEDQRGEAVSAVSGLEQQWVIVILSLEE